MESPLCNAEFLTGLSNSPQNLAGVVVEDGCTHGDGKQQIFTCFPGAITASAGAAMLSPEFTGVAIIDHGVQGRISPQDNATSVTPITPIRATSRDIFFTTKAHAAAATVAGEHLDDCFVYKFHRVSTCAHSGVLYSPKTKKPRRLTRLLH